MASTVLTAKPFQLIQFIQVGRQPKKRSVDITLFKWMRYDKVKKRLVSKFMPEPYTDETKNVLYDMIRKQQKAPLNWPEYCIKILGHADSYEQSVDRLNILRMEEYAFTTDAEIDNISKKEQIEQLVKDYNPYDDNLNNILKAPSLNEMVLERNENKVSDPLAVADEQEDGFLDDISNTPSRMQINKFKRKMSFSATIDDENENNTVPTFPKKRRHDLSSVLKKKGNHYVGSSEEEDIQPRKIVKTLNNNNNIKKKQMRLNSKLAYLNDGKSNKRPLSIDET
ncbi:uncharacterized protein LOC122505683 [Leptopilina heterotoma]|uniref:uncharacterized protein LOC122505683 n=1 Tax=Leptopilina heterotoma TaxID=63436 RepID=UPI001CA85805|nr:uncharacterized protein LOC122505683 [Leptopilina heterotoma]